MRPKGTILILSLIAILTFGIIGANVFAGPNCDQACRNLGYSKAYCSVWCGSDPAPGGFQDCFLRSCCCSASSKIISCNYPLSNCNNNCINLGNDPNNCGYCSHSCGSGSSCSNGVCTTPQPPPGGGNVCCCDTGSNCQSNCYMTTSCTHGLGESQCPSSACQNQPSGCSYPNTQCSTGCVNLQNDPNNCGSCGHSCGAGVACNSGQCSSSGSCTSTDTKNYVCQNNQIYSCGSYVTSCTHCCTGTANCPSNYGACCLATACAGTSPGGTTGFAISATATDQTNNNQGTSITVSSGDVILVSGTVTQNGSPITTLCQNCVTLVNPDNNFQFDTVGIVSGGIYRATMTIPQQNSQTVFHMVAQYTPASVSSNQLTFAISNGNTGTANNVRLDKITVSWLDNSGNTRQIWDVCTAPSANAPCVATGQTPTIPTWNSNDCPLNSGCDAGNMRINYDFTNTGSSSLSLSVATQTHGQVSGQTGDSIKTSAQSIGPGGQASHTHWIRMWSESISETNNILISDAANGPSFTFVVNNGRSSGNAGKCSGSISITLDNSQFAIGSDVTGSVTYSYDLGNSFSCTSSSCTPGLEEVGLFEVSCASGTKISTRPIARVNSQITYAHNSNGNTIPFDFTQFLNNPTALTDSSNAGKCYGFDFAFCTTPFSVSNPCYNGTAKPSATWSDCSWQGQNQNTGISYADSGSEAGLTVSEFRLIAATTTTNTTTTPPTSTSSTPPTSTSSTPPTSTSSTPPTSTSSTGTVTTPSTIQPLPLSCSLCSANSPCSCSIPSNSCNNGFWSVQNLFGTPLPQINITTIPPYIVFFFPNQTGTVNATANCFDMFPNNRSNSSLVTVLNPFLSCPQTCTAGSQCTCTVNNCNSGLFFAVFNNSVFSFQPFATNPYQASFIQPSIGNVTAISTCDSPQMPSARASIQIIGTSTTTNTTTITNTPPVSGSFTHSNFICSQGGSKWTCSLNYNNQLSQQAFLYFDAYSGGKIAQNARSITLTPGSGPTSTIFDCTTLPGSGTYKISFKVYQTQNRDNNPVDWSTSAEVQQIRC